MATDSFVGVTVLLTLKSPLNTTLQGQVAHVRDQKLFLQHGKFAFVGV